MVIGELLRYRNVTNSINLFSSSGYGTMALSNALGSNTFAILMCLGVPWLIKISFFEQSHSGSITISSGGIEYTACIVVIALIVVFSILLINRFRLKLKVWSVITIFCQSRLPAKSSSLILENFTDRMDICAVVFDIHRHQHLHRIAIFLVREFSLKGNFELELV